MPSNETVTMSFVANTFGFDSKIQKSKKELKSLGRQATQSAKRLKRFATAAAGAGSAIIAFIGIRQAGRALSSLTKRSENFNQAMRSSIAIMSDVTEALEKDMVAAAFKAASSTKFAAKEIATSYFFLASAGLSAAQSIEAIPLVSKFAQAGMFDMALATDLLTDAQSALGLKLKDTVANAESMARVADVLVKANTLANASVLQFSQALTTKAGAAMKFLNIRIEEGVAVLAAFADQGLKASDAGTAFNIVTRDLTTKAIKNAQAFRELGIRVFDSTGKLNNMADIIGDLEVALDGMNAKQAKATILSLGFADKSSIFLQTLIGMSSEIRRYEKELDKAGDTTERVSNSQLTLMAKSIAKVESNWTALATTLRITDRMAGLVELFAAGIARVDNAMRLLLDGSRRIIPVWAKWAIIIGTTTVAIIGTAKGIAVVVASLTVLKAALAKTAIGLAVVQALSGPAGWVALAGAVAAATGTFVLLNAAFKTTATSASTARKRADELVKSVAMIDDKPLLELESAAEKVRAVFDKVSAGLVVAESRMAKFNKTALALQNIEAASASALDNVQAMRAALEELDNFTPTFGADVGLENANRALAAIEEVKAGAADAKRLASDLERAIPAAVASPMAAINPVVEQGRKSMAALILQMEQLRATSKRFDLDKFENKLLRLGFRDALKEMDDALAVLGDSLEDIRRLSTVEFETFDSLRQKALDAAAGVKKLAMEEPNAVTRTKALGDAAGRASKRLTDLSLKIEAASDAATRLGKIDKTMTALRDQVAVLGKNAAALALYRLELLKAEPATLRLAEGLLKQVSDFAKQEAAIESSREVAGMFIDRLNELQAEIDDFDASDIEKEVNALVRQGRRLAKEAGIKFTISQSTIDLITNMSKHLRNLADDASAFQELKDQANALFQSTRTPLERYNDELARLRDLAATIDPLTGKPLIDTDTLNRGLKRAQDLLRGLKDQAQNFIGAKREFVSTFNDTIAANLAAKLNLGKQAQAKIGQAQQKPKQKFPGNRGIFPFAPPNLFGPPGGGGPGRGNNSFSASLALPQSDQLGRIEALLQQLNTNSLKTRVG